MQTVGQIRFSDDSFQKKAGRDEFIKERTKDEEKSRQKMESLIKLSNRILFKTQSAFFLNPYPAELIIDESKITVIYKEFPFSEQVHSFLIRDINEVIVETSPFFATLVIVDQQAAEPEIKITYLKKNEAIKARNIIQGLIVSYKAVTVPATGGVDLSEIDQGELTEKLEELGDPNEELY